MNAMLPRLSARIAPIGDLPMPYGEDANRFALVDDVVDQPVATETDGSQTPKSASESMAGFRISLQKRDRIENCICDGVG